MIFPEAHLGGRHGFYKPIIGRCTRCRQIQPALPVRIEADILPRGGLDEVKQLAVETPQLQEGVGPAIALCYLSLNPSKPCKVIPSTQSTAKQALVVTLHLVRRVDHGDLTSMKLPRKS